MINIENSRLNLPLGKGEVESSNLSGSTIKTSMKSITC